MIGRIADVDQRLRNRVRVLAQPRAQTAAEQHDLHVMISLPVRVRHRSSSYRPEELVVDLPRALQILQLLQARERAELDRCPL